uniref:NADPH oxidase activator 1 n=1 Tax=Gouania willdenowi TaxID=441366 RepID=A0A8C5NBY5_GOUWI
MLYTELLKLWDESVQAIDAKDWQGALAKLEQITEPTSRTLFNAAAAHLALGQQDEALKALDFAIAKDDRLAVGFFQRAAVMIQVNRLEEALSDCIWAQKHMRGNMVIDYKQLGLRHKLFSWQVLYNAAAVYCRMNQWEQATEVLLSAMQEKGGGRGGVNIEATLERVARKEFLEPLMVPVDAVFRPRKQDVEQLEKRDFLGKAKVISSMIPNDDFGGFEPLRLQVSQLVTSHTLTHYLDSNSTLHRTRVCETLTFSVLQTEDPLTNRTILYQMVALYDYASQGPEDLEFSEGETIDILGEVNEEWLEGHCAGNVGIFPSCFAYRETDDISQSRML